LSLLEYSIFLGKCSNLNMFYSIHACLSQTSMPSSTFLQIWLGKLDGNKSKVFANLFISYSILKSLKRKHGRNKYLGNFHLNLKFHISHLSLHSNLTPSFDIYNNIFKILYWLKIYVILLAKVWPIVPFASNNPIFTYLCYQSNLKRLMTKVKMLCAPIGHPQVKFFVTNIQSTNFGKNIY
jgi:hypothetical protein